MKNQYKELNEKLTNIKKLSEECEKIITQDMEFNIETYKNYYKFQNYISSKCEKFFYEQFLLKNFQGNGDKNKYNIYFQVPMYAIINEDKKKINTHEKENMAKIAFEFIKAKSIDFAITDKKNKIILCIELDDPTHEEDYKKNLDKIKNKVFSCKEINLLRISQIPKHDDNGNVNRDKNNKIIWKNPHLWTVTNILKSEKKELKEDDLVNYIKDIIKTECENSKNKYYEYCESTKRYRLLNFSKD